ncbi:acyltransferase family protein [Sphingobacterium sp. SG20118]|uniref:acyltransferase family protein n=1 Tax=Sphingobacterium sp. SG20118 TaxID=3367156 RepID=UPI0037DFC79F
MERDKSIDIIRSIGLICIILAHINPPFTIFQIRNFDVPLMIFISGYLFGDKNQTFNSLNDFSSYLWKRFVRLVIPVWLFLSVFYSIQYAFPFLFKINYTDFPDIMISSYMLMDGFGYVWIIRVFLMIAILGPLCSRIIKKPMAIIVILHYL